MKTKNINRSSYCDICFNVEKNNPLLIGHICKENIIRRELNKYEKVDCTAN
jgi:hypothetical protein